MMGENIKEKVELIKNRILLWIVGPLAALVSWGLLGSDESAVFQEQIGEFISMAGALLLAGWAILEGVKEFIAPFLNRE